MASIADQFPAPTTPRRKARDVPIWPIVIVFYSTLLPLEARFALGSLELYAYRLALLAVFPWVIGRLMRGAIRLAAPDALIVFAGLWMFVAMGVNYDLATGIESGGALAFDLMTAYFLARISLRSPEAVRRLLLMALPGVLITAAILAIESVTKTIFIQPLVSALFGQLNTNMGGSYEIQERLGLGRAIGPFPHSILGGVQMSSFMALYAFSGLSPKKRQLGIISSAAAFFTLSSAAIIGLALNLVLMTYEAIQKRVTGLSWALLIYTSLALVALIELVSKGGIFSVIVRYLTLNPWTGYYRMITWEYAAADVWRSPWVGIGFEGFTRPVWMTSPSIDAYWLLTAVRFGLPCALALGLATVIALIMLMSVASQSDQRDRSFFIGVAISLLVMAMLLFTVTLWGTTLAWFTILLGSAVGAARGTKIERRAR